MMCSDSRGCVRFEGVLYMQKTNERKSVALDLAKGKIAMLERENEALRRQLDSINAVTFHGCATAVVALQYLPP